MLRIIPFLIIFCTLLPLGAEESPKSTDAHHSASVPRQSLELRLGGVQGLSSYPQFSLTYTLGQLWQEEVFVIQLQEKSLYAYRLDVGIGWTLELWPEHWSDEEAEAAAVNKEESEVERNPWGLWYELQARAGSAWIIPGGNGPMRWSFVPGLQGRLAWSQAPFTLSLLHRAEFFSDALGLEAGLDLESSMEPWGILTGLRFYLLKPYENPVILWDYSFSIGWRYLW